MHLTANHDTAYKNGNMSCDLLQEILDCITVTMVEHTAILLFNGANVNTAGFSDFTA